MINELLYGWDSMKTKLWYAYARVEGECRYRRELARVDRLEKKRAAAGRKTTVEKKQKQKNVEQKNCRETGIDLIASKDVREYLTRIGKQFTEVELDSLKYNVRAKKRGSNKIDYVFIPHPFRRGDICKTVNSDMVGIVFWPASEREMYRQTQCSVEWMKKASQMCIEVTVLNGNGEFVHECIPVDEVEYAHLSDAHPARCLLEEARELMLGRGSIPCVQELQKEYKEWLKDAR